MASEFRNLWRLTKSSISVLVEMIDQDNAVVSTEGLRKLRTLVDNIILQAGSDGPIVAEKGPSQPTSVRPFPNETASTDSRGSSAVPDWFVAAHSAAPVASYPTSPAPLPLHTFSQTLFPTSTAGASPAPMASQSAPLRTSSIEPGIAAIGQKRGLPSDGELEARKWAKLIYEQSVALSQKSQPKVRAGQLYSNEESRLLQEAVDRISRGEETEGNEATRLAGLMNRSRRAVKKRLSMLRKSQGQGSGHDTAAGDTDFGEDEENEENSPRAAKVGSSSAAGSVSPAGQGQADATDGPENDAGEGSDSVSDSEVSDAQDGDEDGEGEGEQQEQVHQGLQGLQGHLSQPAQPIVPQTTALPPPRPLKPPVVIKPEPGLDASGSGSSRSAYWPHTS